MLRRALWILLLALPPAARADEPLSLRGFGTLGISCFGDRNADFVYNTMPVGPGRTRTCDAGLDSVLGVQADAVLGQGLGATVQLTSQRTAYDNFKPAFSLANLHWQASDALTIRLGRVSNPLFLDSDYRLVHFSLAGVRPPAEVYGLSPTFTMDGIDAIYRHSADDWNFEYFAAYQGNDIDAPESNSATVDTAKLSRVLTLSVDAEHGPWLYKAAYSGGRVTYATDATDALFDGLRSIDAISPGAAALADQLDMRDAPYRLYTAALRYDGGDWLVQGEIAERTFDKSYFRDSNAGYLTAGYRIGPWMPYGTLARRKTWGPDGDSRAGPLAAEVADLLAATRYDQSSLTLGISRELGKGAVVKAQIEWLQPDRGGYGNSLVNASPDYNPADPPLDRLISVNVNFVF